MTKDEIIKEAQKRISEIEGEEIELICRVKPRLPISKLKNAISDQFDLPWPVILTHNRKRPLVLARQLFCYIAYHDLGYGCSYVGQILGRDHTTAIYGREAIEDALSINDIHTIELLTRIRERAAA